MSTDTAALRSWLAQMQTGLARRSDHVVEGSAVVSMLIEKLDAGAFEASPKGTTGRAARTYDPSTSKEAAALASGEFDETIRTRVLQLFVEHADLTDDEMRSLLAERGIENSTPAVRRGELAARGFLRDTGITRPSKHGRQMIVWALSPAWRGLSGVPQP